MNHLNICRWRWSSRFHSRSMMRFCAFSSKRFEIHLGQLEKKIFNLYRESQKWRNNSLKLNTFLQNKTIHLHATYFNSLTVMRFGCRWRFAIRNTEFKTHWRLHFCAHTFHSDKKLLRLENFFNFEFRSSFK